MTLNEIAGMFGVSSYGVVGWACIWARLKMDSDKRFRKKVEEAMNKTYKQKILPLLPQKNLLPRIPPGSNVI